MRYLMGIATLSVVAWGNAALGKTGGSSEHYSLQLATFNSKGDAEKFIKKLPAPLKEEAFIYVTDRGYITVRIWPTTDLDSLKKKKLELINSFGLNSVIVKTELSKVPNRASSKRAKLVTYSKGELLYSIQIATFKNPRQAKAYLSSLPEELKSQAFVYVTDS
jgi:cell division septation protein DedD